jgi:hypothetical protein
VIRRTKTLRIRDGNVELYTMQVDGTNQARFTTNPAQDFAADWGP